MTTATLTPHNTKTGRVVNLAGRQLWRKQILPNDSINYNGRQIRFDTAYHKELVRNFRSGAYDSVPFQLATATNEHTNDPERTRGSLVELRAEPDGLYGYFDLSTEMRKLVESNPKFGVSCRILEDYTREHDGRRFGRSLQHVLGTLDPRITGMKPWESVELSGAHADVTVDLASSDWTSTQTGGGPVPESQTEDKVVVELSAAQLERLNALLDDGEEGSGGLGGASQPDDQDESGLSAQFLDPSWFEDGDDFTDLDGDGEDDETEDDSEQDDEEPGGDSLVMATVRNLQSQVLELTNKLGTRDSAVERAQLAATGLAPAIIDLAMPLLAVGPDAGVLQLSNGEATNVADQTRKLLRAVLDLSQRGLDLVRLDGETGWAEAADGASAQRGALLKEMDEIYGR